jgi:hypothetical protein
MGPKEDSKPRKLSVAVAKAHTLMDRAARGKIENDDISESIPPDHFNGEFAVSIRIKSVGVNSLSGHFVVKRGRKLRYRTEEERSVLASFSERTKLLEDERDERVNGVWDNSYYVQQGKDSQLLKGRKKLNAMGKARVKDLKREYAEQIGEVKAERLVREKEIRANESRRRQSSEWVSVNALILEGALTKKVINNLPKMKSLPALVRVHEVSYGEEPEEIGGARRIATLELEIVGSLVKNVKRNKGE